MVVFSVSSGSNKNSTSITTVHVEGEVLASDWQKLRALCLDDLKCSDQLVLDIEMIEAYDFSFSILVCLLRKTAKLLRKRLTVQGKHEESFICLYNWVPESRINQCSFAEAPPHCLWEKLPARTLVL
jgi:hypothetical protein